MNKKESLLIKHLDDYGLDIFSLSQFEKENILSKYELRRAIQNLVRNKYLDIIERGWYCKHNFRDHFVIGSRIATDGVISYWNAMNFHHLTEQISNVIFVKTSQRKKNKIIFGIQHYYSQKTSAKIGGFTMEGYGTLQYKMANVEQTIVDAFDKPKYSGGYAEIIKAFHYADLDPDRLIKYCRQEENVSLIKRLGFLSEFLQKSNMENFILYAKSVVKQKYTLFEIGGEEKGKTNSDWKLILNIPPDEILEMAISLS